MLVVLSDEKKSLERLIDNHINQYVYLKDNYALLQSIPGIGPVVSRYMVVIIGS